MNFSQNAMKIKKSIINFTEMIRFEIKFGGFWQYPLEPEMKFFESPFHVKWTIIGSMIHHVCPVIVLMDFIDENGQIIHPLVYKDSNKNLQISKNDSIFIFTPGSYF